MVVLNVNMVRYVLNKMNVDVYLIVLINQVTNVEWARLNAIHTMRKASEE